jgi:L-threonylcarbamoyladenylate synthase
MMLDGRSPDAIAAAVQTLKAGELVGLPTETVYGLAADAGSDAAVARIFAAKGRPANHPLIVHVADASGVDHFAANVPDFARRLIDAFWPGPLTLILPRRPGVGAAAAGGQDSIGLRCPSHPVAQAVLRACAAQGVFGLAAPSANPFGRVSPTTAAHVQAGMGDALLVLDGGACDVGIESTIVDCTRGAPVLLRPGGISRAQVEAACGQPLRDGEPRSRARSESLGHLAGALCPGRAGAADGCEGAADGAGPARRRRGPHRHLVPCHPQDAFIRRDPPAHARRCRRHRAAAVCRAARVRRAGRARLIWIETPPGDPRMGGGA